MLQEGLWEGHVARKCEQPLGAEGRPWPTASKPQFYNLKEPILPTIWAWKSAPNSRKEQSLTNTFILALWDPKQRPQLSWTHGNNAILYANCRKQIYCPKLTSSSYTQSDQGIKEMNTIKNEKILKTKSVVFASQIYLLYI